MRPKSTPVLTILVSVLAFSPIAFAHEDESPLPDAQMGRRTAKVLLLTRHDVLTDLGMTPDQIKKAQKTATAFWLKADDLKGKPNPKLLKARQMLETQMNRWIETALSQQQIARLDQIDLWWEGPSTLVSRPAVAMTLKLTPEQKTTLQAALQQREAAHAKGQNEERMLAAKTLEILTPEQLVTWKQLLGREFVPELARKESATLKR